MKDLIYYGVINSEAGAKLSLRDIETDKIYEAFYNKNFYQEKEVLFKARLSGAGSATVSFTYFYVLINDNGKIKPGILTIDALLPNS
jgi:hypothetical protein